MPKISGATLADHREQVRRHVFDAFAELMAEHSFEAISMAQIAARAGLGRTAIYHHFPDKEAVVVAFASHETAQYVADLSQALTGSDDPVARLGVYIRHQLRAGEQFHMGLGVQLIGMLSPQARQEIREHVVAVESVLRAIVEAGVASGDFVVDDVDTTMSLVHACLSPRHLPADEIERFVLRGLGVAG
ncbi:TetR/AcrR family transcriptional regulator [Nocardioides pacificus]